MSATLYHHANVNLMTITCMFVWYFITKKKALARQYVIISLVLKFGGPLLTRHLVGRRERNVVVKAWVNLINGCMMFNKKHAFIS
jgi:hypothetical protein